MDGNGLLVYDVDEVARLLHLGKSSVYRGAMTGQIPSVRVGRRVLFPRARLEEFLREVQGKGVAENGLEGGNPADLSSFGVLTKAEP